MGFGLAQLFLQHIPPASFSSKKFLNTIDPSAVFMIEDRRVVAGEATLSGVATIEGSERERSRQERIHAALEALVLNHSRLVYRITYAVLRSHHDAEDATQEAFLRVLKYQAKLDAVEDAKTWLARIAWRVAVDRSKARGRRQEIALDDPETAPVRPASTDIPADDLMHSSQVGAALERFITALPRKLREPLILSTVEEMSPSEAARTLGISEAAVRSRVFRARQILKEKLAQTTSVKSR